MDVFLTIAALTMLYVLNNRYTKPLDTLLGFSSPILQNKDFFAKSAKFQPLCFNATCLNTYKL